MPHFQNHSEDGTPSASSRVAIPQRAATPPYEDSDHHRGRHLSPPGTSSVVEALAEAWSIIDRLYSPANSASNASPDHRLAHALNNTPESTNVQIVSHEDPLSVALLRIESSVSERLELLRLLALRDNVNRASHFAHPITARTNRAPGAFYIVPGFRGEGTSISSPGSQYTSHIPGLYHEQWLQSPAISPPAYTAFCHCCPQGSLCSPPPSPAPEMSPRDVDFHSSDVQLGVLREGESQEQRHCHRSMPTAPAGGIMSSSTPHHTTLIDPRTAGYSSRVPDLDDHHAGVGQGAGAPAESPPLAALRAPESTASLRRHRRSLAGGEDHDHGLPDLFAARLDSDSESGGWLDNVPDSDLGGARSRWG